MREFEQSDMLKRLPEQFFAKLSKKVQLLKEQGYDIINLGQGNPDQPTPEHIVKELQIAAEDPKYHRYSPFEGFSIVKEAVAEFYKREYDVEIDPEEEVSMFFGAKQGLVDLAQGLLNPGDIALLPDPGYPDYLSGTAMAGAESVYMPLVKENDFLPDYSEIPKDKLEKARLMVLNYPNNPTAGTATKAFFDETVKLAKDHNFCVAHDFAYGSLGFDGQKPISFLQSEGAKDIGVEIYTMSKTYNMAGWRIAFAVGNKSVIRSLNLIQDHIHVSLFGAIQQAAAKALTGDQTVVQELLEMYERRRNTFVKALHENGWKVDSPKGTFFSWLKVPDGYTSEGFTELLLKEAQVVVAPGNGFGTHGEGYVRAGINASEEELEEAARRIGKLELF
ncbi:pyridoxal phosphate-dependent aminotransferase [Virgibacillus kekensis]|uniref:Pyridoxal phosphate-dependent aminotransferase n=1 Tax=Virgibacillus kekensis TaxID=202261 RepID=A0ABV9DIS2_9BACI